MDDAIARTAEVIDRKLATLALQLGGSPQGAVALLAAVERAELTAVTRSFLLEGGALLRARKLLVIAMRGERPAPAPGTRQQAA